MKPVPFDFPAHTYKNSPRMTEMLDLIGKGMSLIHFFVHTKFSAKTMLL